MVHAVSADISNAQVRSVPLPRERLICYEVFRIYALECKLTYPVDAVAFGLIICLSRRGVGKISTLIRTIVEDATVYFLVIFTSHIILAFFILFARVSLGFPRCNDI